jgi:2-polyprenyl-6-hydroxyphenyl methylase/3-demethylubiquinone-9 3-methyltransferase
MNVNQRTLLDKVPALSYDVSSSPKCKLCSGDTSIFDCVDFNKHCSSDPYRFGASGISVPYYQCSRCNFIFTDFIDEWSNEEVAKYIYNSDYLKVDPEYEGSRAIRVAVEVARHFAGCEGLRILDYGSGSGVFAEEMRKRGFEFVENYDPFSSPTDPAGHFDLITCFEVIEHSPRPADTLADMERRLSAQGVIIIGQTLQPSNIEEIGGRWWYMGPRNGHVSFFAEETFITLANLAGLTYHRCTGFYAFAREKLSGALADVLQQSGSPVHLRTLVAPDTGQPATGWQGTERMAGKRLFRWSTEANVFWPQFELRSGVNMIQIPYLMSICDGFAERCVIVVDGKRVATRVERHRIIGEVEVLKRKVCRVSLQTPQPLTPFELRGLPDTRPLGLAVACW